VVPLALYLVSFILAFARLPVTVHRAFALALPITLLILVGTGPTRWLQLALHLGLFFAAAMVCHGELARDRPPVTHLTKFYLLMSFGGVLGGSFNALVAPSLFSSIVEYPLMMVAACLLLPAWRRGDLLSALWRRIVPGSRAALASCRATPGRANAFDLILPAVFGLAVGLLLFNGGPSPYIRLAMAAACVSFLGRPIRFGFAIGALLLLGNLSVDARLPVLHQERNFFGVIKVGNDAKRNVHWLIHGRTEHGAQLMHENRNVRQLPRLYYDATGPIGQLFMANLEGGVRSPVAVVGLGTGSLAS